jgi:hypothetical protein
MATAKSPEALRLGWLLDAHHLAVGQVEPSLGTGTCDLCGFLIYSPSVRGSKHLPTGGESARVETWLEDNL